MRTQKPLKSTGWLGGADNRLVVHEGAKAMSDHVRNCECGSSDCDYRAVVDATPPDLDSDVDDKQMTHSDEPTVYDPTTKTERDDMLKRRGKHTGRLLYGPKTMMGRLCADVERLDRQLGDELAADSVLCPHAPNHILEAKCKELETENKRLRKSNRALARAALEAERGSPQCPHCHPDSRWP